MVVLDAMEKGATVRLLQTELNDSPGVCLKLHGSVGDLESAARAAEEAAAGMEIPIIAHVIPGPSNLSRAAYEAASDFNPLIEQSSVNKPEYKMRDQTSFAVGLIETQGFTAVFEAIDTALKTADVEVPPPSFSRASTSTSAVFNAVSIASNTAVKPWVSISPTAKLFSSRIVYSGLFTEDCSIRGLKSDAAS